MKKYIDNNIGMLTNKTSTQLPGKKQNSCPVVFAELKSM